MQWCISSTTATHITARRPMNTGDLNVDELMLNHFMCTVAYMSLA
jgi:kynurenine formamidase